MTVRVIADRAALDHVVRRLGAEITAAYPDGAVLVGVLKGSVVFLSDLVRHIGCDVRIDFLALSSFEPGATRVRVVKDLDQDVTGRDVVLVEDVVDTGLTANYITDLLRRRGARSVAICALIDRRPRRLIPLEIAFRGIGLDDEFALGYGLDVEGRYRNLGVLAVGDERVLRVDPDAYVPALYRPLESGSGALG